MVHIKNKNLKKKENHYYCFYQENVHQSYNHKNQQQKLFNSQFLLAQSVHFKLH